MSRLSWRFLLALSATWHGEAHKRHRKATQVDVARSSLAIAEEPVTPAPAPPNPSKTDTPDQRRTSAQKIRVSRRPIRSPTDAARTGSQGSSEADRHLAAQRTIPTAENSPPRETLAGSGAEELAVAQGYLNGTNGQGRNSAEAAKWLWKAIAKHNADATFLLSEMYLKGDGVSKNCDQARVLLDAAALRGVKGAGRTPATSSGFWMSVIWETETVAADSGPSQGRRIFE